MKIIDQTGTQVALMEFIPWQDGSIIRYQGGIPLEGLLPLVLPKPEGLVIAVAGAQLSTVLNVTENDFRKWPELLENRSNLRGVVEPGT